MDTSYLEDAAKEVMADTEEESSTFSESGVEADSEGVTIPDDSDEDIPSFLDTQDDGEAKQEFSFDDDEGEDSTPEPQASEDTQTLKYTAEGKEFTATPEEAVKALSMMKGARRAFSERAKLKRQVKQLQEQADANAEFRQYWEQAMAKSSNPAELFQELTGQSFDDVLENELQRRQMYANATDEQRQLLDYEDRFNQMQSKLDHFQTEAERKQKELASSASEARKQHLSGLMEPVFYEHAEKFEDLGLSRVEQNDLKEILWSKSIRDMKKAITKGYKPNRSVVRKIFDRNAKILLRDNGEQIQQGVKQELSKRSQDAKEKAQIASTQNYKGPADYKELVGANPKDLFSKMFSKR